MHLNDMLESRGKGRIALVRAEHEESLLTVKRALDEDLADFILIGNRSAITKLAQQIDLSLDRCEIIPSDDDREAAEIGAQMASDLRIDGIMKGLIQTSVFTKALLKKEYKLIPPGGLISHFGLFELPGLPHPVGITDAALNIHPDLKEKIQILINAIELMHSLGIECVKTACIAPVEKENPKMISTMDAGALSRMDWSGAVVEGPLGLDAALSAEAAAVKGIESRVAGKPDLLMFPDLNSANGVYKAFSFFPGNRNAGILAGLSIPVILTSRSDPEETRYLSLKLALKTMERYERDSR
jgi:phosphate butyryltransferase